MRVRENTSKRRHCCPIFYFALGGDWHFFRLVRPGQPPTQHERILSLDKNQARNTASMHDRQSPSSDNTLPTKASASGETKRRAVQRGDTKHPRHMYRTQIRVHMKTTPDRMERDGLQGEKTEEKKNKNKNTHLSRHLSAKLLSLHPRRHHHRVRGLLSVPGLHGGSHHRVLLLTPNRKTARKLNGSVLPTNTYTTHTHTSRNWD